MRLRTFAPFTLPLLALTGCGTNDPNDPVGPTGGGNVVDTIAESLQVEFEVVENVPTESPETAPASLCVKSKLTLTNTGGDWNDKSWKIYYSSIRKVLSVDNEQFEIEHVNGDLHTLAPTDAFEGFARGESKDIPLTAEFWM